MASQIIGVNIIRKNDEEKDRKEEQSTIEGYSELLHEFMFKQVMVTCEAYRYLMIMSAFLVCLSHGSNDVANAISPLIVILKVPFAPDERQAQIVAYTTGSLGIAIGLLALGRVVMETVGKDIVILDFQKGFAAQFSTATCVCLGTGFGMPLSTTHCTIGALAGIYVASKIELISSFYWKK